MFKELQDKALTLVDATYRGLVLDFPANPRMLVFDKTVADTTRAALLARVRGVDPTLAGQLAAKINKLHYFELTQAQGAIAVKVAAGVRPEVVHAHAKKLRPTLAGKMTVTALDAEVPQEDEGAQERAEEAEKALVRLEQRALILQDLDEEELRSTDGRQQLAQAQEALNRWLDTQADVAAEALVKRAEQVAEALTIVDARLQLHVAPVKRRALPEPPRLVWAWCDKHLPSGPMRNQLKVSLPKYEKAVVAFQKAPGEETFAAADDAIGEVVDALQVGRDGYVKSEEGGAESERAKLTAKLLEAATREARTLKDAYGDGEGLGADDAKGAITAALLGDEERIATLMEQAEKAVREHERNYAKRIEEAPNEGMRGVYRQQLEMKVSDARADVAMKTMQWALIGPCFPADRPAHKKLAAVIPPYETAKAAMKATPGVVTIQAAVDALERVRIVIHTLREDRTAAEWANLGVLSATCKAERALLHRMEGELPGARLAKRMMAQEDGAETLDAWVARMGGSAKTPEDKGLVRAALKARHGLTQLEGDMTTKALPRFYDVMSRVPKGHTAFNESLLRLSRDKSGMVPDGYYSSGTQRAHVQVQSVGKAGLQKKVFEFAIPILEKPPGGWKGSGLKKPKSTDVFDHLTLHEVGHAVDDQLGFMDSRLGNPTFGGWKKESAASVVEAARTKMGFAEDFPEWPEAFHTAYLTAILEGKDPSAENSVTSQAFRAPQGDRVDTSPPNWRVLAKHDAVRFLQAARLDSGAIEQVTQWNHKAKNAVADGRVYQEAYSNTWWSYDVGARKKGIGGYQFRAPGEWFSEVYANYFGGRLASNHPDYAMMKALVDME